METSSMRNPLDRSFRVAPGVDKDAESPFQVTPTLLNEGHALHAPRPPRGLAGIGAYHPSRRGSGYHSSFPEYYLKKQTNSREMNILIEYAWPT